MINLETGQYTPAQLADSNLPTPAESQLLTQVNVEVRVCQNSFVTAEEQTFPAIATLARQMQSETYAVQDKLTNRQLSWGQAAQQSKQILEIYAARLRETRLT
jgi:hypothetical protein